MALIDQDIEEFADEQKERIDEEVQHWHDFKDENPEGVYLPFWEHHRKGQVLESGNRVPEDQERDVREYVQHGDVVEIDGILVDLVGIQIPFNCFWKSCRLTGNYCCTSRGPSQSETAEELMRESGRQFVDKFDGERQKSAIRDGDTHTDKLSLMRRMDGLCLFGEEEYEEDPETGEEHAHVSCRLHEGAIENDIPLHHVLGFGPTLFPADILLVDGKWFITAAHERPKEARATRWWTTSEHNPCTKVGDTNPYGILQAPSMDTIFRAIFGDDKVDSIQEEAYGEVGPAEKEIEDGWIRPEERDLTEHKTECDECEGAGCSNCDNRGWFKVWEK